PPRQRLSAAVVPSLLDGWARHRAVGAEDAAIAMPGLEQRAASGAIVEIKAGVSGHGLDLDRAAGRAGERRLQDRGHTGGSIQKVRASKATARTMAAMLATSKAGRARAVPGEHARARRC